MPQFSISMEQGTRYVGRTAAVLGPAKFQTKVQHDETKRSEVGPQRRLPLCARPATGRCGRTPPSRAVDRAIKGGQAWLETGNPVEAIGVYPDRDTPS